MFRQYPRHETRVVINRFIRQFFEIIREHYYPSFHFMAAVEFSFISNAIMLANVVGMRLNVTDLAARIEMPRTTLRDKLRQLATGGYVVREGGYVDVPQDRLAAPLVNTALDRLASLIIVTGKTLEMMRDSGQL